MRYILILLMVFSFETAFAKKKQKAPEGCDMYFAKEKICGVVTWTKKPVVVAAPTAKDAAEFDLKLWDLNQGRQLNKAAVLKADQQLAVSLYMPDMGHGSEPVILRKDDKTPGLYHVTQVLFSMEGAWEIRGRIQQGAKTIDSAAMPFLFK